jgi:hypothetical protein
MTNIDHAIEDARELAARKIGDMDAADIDACMAALGGRVARIVSRFGIQGGHTVVVFEGINGRTLSVQKSPGGRQTAVLYEKEMAR